ncbi:hypothetical protein DFJ73DRAFT_49226 [Zopfochytrium polystomum]|nr:hypothetical protein DFJ73DRAFT_49226 [Zopfochytrium polystomum]
MLTIKVHPSLSLSTFISGLKRGTFSYWSGAQLFLREENDLIFIHSTSINDLWMVLEELDELSAAWSERLGCCLVLHSCPNPDTLLDGVKILFKLSKAVQASKEELQALGRLYIKCVLQLDALPSPWSKKVQFLVNTLFQKVKNGEEEYRAHLDNMDSSLPHFNAYLKVLCWMLRVHSKISCVSPAFNSSRNLHDEYCDWLRQMTSLLKYSLPFNVLSSSQSDKTLSDFCILFSRFLTEGTGDLTFIK